MDKKEGVVSAEDGIRKLRLLDAKGKIWSQDVRLMMTDKDVVLMDEYTQVGGNLHVLIFLLHVPHLIPLLLLLSPFSSS